MTFSSSRNIAGDGYNVSAFISNTELVLNMNKRAILDEVLDGVVKEATQVFLKENIDDIMARLDPDLIGRLVLTQIATDVVKAIRGEK